jgi:hypothetical protein
METSIAPVLGPACPTCQNYGWRVTTYCHMIGSEQMIFSDWECLTCSETLSFSSEEPPTYRISTTQ